jgi:hypothetical protein
LGGAYDAAGRRFEARCTSDRLTRPFSHMGTEPARQERLTARVKIRRLAAGSSPFLSLTSGLLVPAIYPRREVPLDAVSASFLNSGPKGAAHGVRRLTMPKCLATRPPLNAAEERHVHQLAHSVHAPADWITHTKMIVRSWDGLRTHPRLVP